MSDTKRKVIPKSSTMNPDKTLTEYGVQVLRGQTPHTWAGGYRRGCTAPDNWEDACTPNSKKIAKKDYYRGQRRDEKELIDELYLEYIEEREEGFADLLDWYWDMSADY